ncbi:MAG: SsrA-binding protein SmpB [Actinobacteria bacterium]|nr:SsrA-binding protein SmpB [Actinomycetota bacterium]
MCAARRNRGDDTVVVNRRARFDYDIGDTYEAGMVLTGTEVKSLREGRMSLAQAWVKVDDSGEAWLMQAHIPEYSHGGHQNHNPTRERKLLLHRHEIAQLHKAVEQKGRTLVPMKVYFNDGFAKLLFGVGTGKAQHDKRRDVAERDARREAQRAIKEFMHD